MAAQLERELTCVICSDLYYRPVALLNCLHTFCGSCAKSWFEEQSGQDAGDRPPGSSGFTCPICREEVRGSNRDARAASLIDWFLGQYPEKARSDEDKQKMDETYRPSDGILPRVAPLTAEQLRLAEEERIRVDRGRTMSLSTHAQERNSGQTVHQPFEPDGELDSGDEEYSGGEEKELIDLATAMSLSVYDHETNARRTEARFSCEMCNRRFRSQLSATQHMDATAHRAERFECETCDREFRSERAAEQHMNDTGHWTEQHFCETCDEEFLSERAAEQHMDEANHWAECYMAQTNVNTSRNIRNMSTNIRNMHNNIRNAFRGLPFN